MVEPCLNMNFLKTILMNYDGISTVVKKIINYGTEKFAVCAVKIS